MKCINMFSSKDWQFDS
uniref:Uncharacterized protein n=1 Tax=Anopheles gambiae TaxID=7165 RepID=A0A453YZY1_ANOGA